jgi:hypothetical protein
MDLVAAALANPINRKILERLPALGLRDCWLVAGCLFQPFWNAIEGRAPQDGIKDYDLFYFDDRDLSYEAEDLEIGRARVLFADLDALVELRNQARVHLWYARKFGAGYPPLASTQEGIDRFLVACTCLGVQPTGDGSIRLHAPFGTTETEQGLLRPNPRAFGLHRFREKAESYRTRWPWLRIQDDDPASPIQG